MPETKREVRPVEINYICDACGTGMMTRCGEMDPQSGDIEHRCLICDHRQFFQWREYPRVEHIGMHDEV
ncbi:type II citrate synthase [Parahaliea maris]|uniref:Type II citrate synthase n=1 Tax=Parahaliea maris TaxID=2716870 RepID=A0A5C8ZSJ4_9GAMM|nr:type II citrate synthase [Parahaliea maris]TXS90719.1 type II citrate synthase [Parahaliea maris]